MKPMNNSGLRVSGYSTPSGSLYRLELPVNALVVENLSRLITAGSRIAAMNAWSTSYAINLDSTGDRLTVEIRSGGRIMFRHLQFLTKLLGL